MRSASHFHRLPKYCNAGSSGPAVAVLLKDISLIAEHMKIPRSEAFEDEVADEIYGPCAMRVARRVQGNLGLEADGHFGQATRKKLRDGFLTFDNREMRIDIERHIRTHTTVGSKSYFVQPNGTVKCYIPLPLD